MRATRNISVVLLSTGWPCQATIDVSRLNARLLGRPAGKHVGHQQPPRISFKPSFSAI